MLRIKAEKMKLGCKVKCHAFIKPSQNHYEIDNEKCICDFWEAGAKEGVAIEDNHSCDRYKMIQKEFTGVFVGSTILRTRINVEYETDDSYHEYYRAYCDTPKEFAVIYYANNKKRYVPIDKLEEVTL